MPSMPTLFIYGTRKRMMFHTDRFLGELRERTDGSRSVALDCGLPVWKLKFYGVIAEE